MLEQGALGLAVPWHAVVRVRLIPTESIDSAARRHRCSVLAPYADSRRVIPERAAVLVGLGLKRGLLVADRLIWRMAADKSAVTASGPGPGLQREAKTEEGESFWIVDPRQALHGVPAPSLDDLLAAPTPSREDKPQGPASKSSPAAVAKRPATKPHTPPELYVLRAEDVEPVGGETGAQAIPSERRAQPISEEPPATEPEQPRPAPADRVALVAEDSLTARIFLSRLLAYRGFRVHAVASAADLRLALERQRWTLVCADVELPDQRGTELLGPLAEQAKRDGHSLVALVRDGADAEAARAAGIVHSLRKPFELEALDRLLSRAGIQPT
jgi:CheY-like chemotaxis protein